MANTLHQSNAHRCAMTKKSVWDHQQLLWLLVLVSAYLLRDIARLPMPDVVYTGLCAIAFLFLKPGSAMGVYMFTSALTVPDFEIRIVYLVVLLAKCILQRKKLDGKMLLIVVVLALLELINLALFLGQGVVSVLYTLGMRLTYVALPLFWLSEDFSREDYHRALLCYIVGVILGGAVVLYMSVEAVGWNVLLEGTSVRLGMNTTGGYETQAQIQSAYNANQLSTMFVLTTVIVAGLLEKKAISGLWAALLIVFSAFMVFLTKSRTGILLLVLIAAVYVWILIIRRKKIVAGLALSIGAVLLVWGIVTWFPEAVQDLLSRFQEKDDFTNGRDQLFVEYLSAWSENLWVILFGYGIGSYKYVVSISNSPHNMITDIRISWGLFGFVVILIMLGYLYRRTARKMERKERFLAFFPSVIAILAVVGGQYLTTGFPNMRLCFLFLAAVAFTKESAETMNAVKERD